MLQFELPLLHGVRRRGRRQARLLVVNGHPDPSPRRYCSALCDAYEAGAHQGGWDVRRLNAGELGVDLGHGGHLLLQAEAQMMWAERLAIVFPLWLNRPPAQLSEVFRLVAAHADHTKMNALKPRPSRIIVTMDMPAFAHRALFRHEDERRELRERFALAGINPAEMIFIGSIGTTSASLREDWLHAMRVFGERGV